MMNSPEDFGFSEVRFIHTPQVVTAAAVRLRCQYLCLQQRQSSVCPPFSPTQQDTAAILEEYRFGLIIRLEPGGDRSSLESKWAAFHANMLEAESECLRCGYGKSFAIAVGNCVFGHLGDTVRPCEFPGKTRPTLEAVGINLAETLDIIGWQHYLRREDEDAFHMFGLLLLE